MTVRWLTDGSAVCNGDADPSRTATYAGPKDSAAQIANIAAFFALEPAPGPDDSQPGFAARIASLELTGRDFPIQRAQPATGATVASDGRPVLALLHASTIATCTVTLPASPRSGQQFTLASRSIVTALTINGGSLIGGQLGTILANGFATWEYSVLDGAWVRVG